MNDFYDILWGLILKSCVIFSIQYRCDIFRNLTVTFYLCALIIHYISNIILVKRIIMPSIIAVKDDKC